MAGSRKRGGEPVFKKRRKWSEYCVPYVPGNNKRIIVIVRVMERVFIVSSRVLY
jgi:hypothetical protein